MKVNYKDVHFYWLNTEMTGILRQYRDRKIPDRHTKRYACLMGENKGIYDVVETETWKPQAGRGSAEDETNNLKTSLRFP